MNSDFAVGVHAMVFLYHKATTLRSDELAENICTNPGRVRRVMAQLKKAGLVETREGRFAGGYTYDRTRQVTLGEISRALHTRYADLGWSSGNEDMECKVASGMAGYMNNLCEALDLKCNSYLDTITIADVEHKLFEHREE